MNGHLPRDCQKLRERLPEYAEGRLAGPARARVERHLETCERCASEVADLRSVIGAVRAIPAEQVPGGLVGRVSELIHEQAPAPAAPTFPWVRLAAPAAVLTGALALALVLRTPPVRQQGQLRYGGEAPPGTVVGVHSGGRARGIRPGGPAKLSERAPVLRHGATAREGRRAPGGAPAAPLARERLDAEPERPLMVAPPAPAAGTARQGERSAAREPMTRDQRSGAPARLESDRSAAGFRAAGESAPARERAGPDAGPEEEAHLKAVAEAPSAGLSAAVALASVEDGKIIALKVTAPEPVGEVALALGDAAPQTFQWQGWAGGPAWIPLLAEQIGPGPTAIPVRLEAGEERRHYVLFVPVLARLGEAAEAAPTARYQEASLRNVLTDFSAFTGLVILAEPPLTVEFTGELPSGKPGPALEELAARLGFDAHREGDLAYTLTHAR